MSELRGENRVNPFFVLPFFSRFSFSSPAFHFLLPIFISCGITINVVNLLLLAMSAQTPYDELGDFLAQLHELLFPEPFSTLSWELLVAQIEVMTTLVNKTLAFYHDESTAQEQVAMGPALCYSQALLAQLVRLAQFEEKDLTRYNQIVADMEAMLVDRLVLIETKFREQAEYQRKMTSDDKLKSMMERFLASYHPE